MPRSVSERSERDVAALRSDLAGIAVGVGLIRVERALAHKYRSDQPRAPAGQPDGGRWVSNPSGDGGSVSSPSGGGHWASLTTDDQPESRTEETVTEDGSRVLSIRIQANRQAVWDEQHTVTTPDGTSTVFETSGLTQTIRDGETREILGRSTLTADGVQPEAFVQTARRLPTP